MKKLSVTLLVFLLIATLCSCNTLQTQKETFNTYSDLSDQNLEKILVPLNEIEVAFATSQSSIQSEISSATSEISDYSKSSSLKRMSEAYDFIAQEISSTFNTIGPLSIEYFSLVFEYTTPNSDTRDILIGQYITKVEKDLVDDYDTFIANQLKEFSKEYESDHDRKLLSDSDLKIIQLTEVSGMSDVVTELKNLRSATGALDSIAVLGVSESDSNSIKSTLESTWNSLQ